MSGVMKSNISNFEQDLSRSNSPENIAWWRGTIGTMFPDAVHIECVKDDVDWQAKDVDWLVQLTDGSMLKIDDKDLWVFYYKKIRDDIFIEWEHRRKSDDREKWPGWGQTSSCIDYLLYAKRTLGLVYKIDWNDFMAARKNQLRRVMKNQWQFKFPLRPRENDGYSTYGYIWKLSDFEKEKISIVEYKI